MSSSTLSTRSLDHIIHLTPPGTLSEKAAQFRAKGFTVLLGGTHADGLTQNVLVVSDTVPVFQQILNEPQALADGVYFELLSFTHTPEHYPAGTPERHARDTHSWATKQPGWIDYAFLGSGTASVADVINARAEADGSGVRYSKETRGGRAKPNGRVLEWVISAPEADGEGKVLRGALPFFCGDVTPREWRIPLDPPNTEHANGVRGVASVKVLTTGDQFAELKTKLTSVIGSHPVRNAESQAVWDLEKLELPTVNQTERTPQLVLDVAKTAEEVEYVRTRGSGIYQVQVYGKRTDSSEIISSL